MLVRNTHGNFTADDRSYAEQKLVRIAKYFATARRVECVHSDEKLGHRVDVTVIADGQVFHGASRDASLRAAIDKVSQKVTEQLRRCKRKLNHFKKKG